MPHNRLFHTSLFCKGKTLSLDEEEKKHAAVFRIKKNDLLELVNGKGELAKVKVVSAAEVFSVEILDFIQQKEPPSFTLATASLKLSKLELIIQKGCELGVSHFQIFDGELSEKTGLSSHQIKRLQSINISALKQCGRLFLPTISFFSSLEKVPFSNHPIFYGAPALGHTSSNKPLLFPSTFFIGPEKGFSEKELKILLARNAHPFGLSLQTLRAETAALAVSAIFGFFQKMS